MSRTLAALLFLLAPLSAAVTDVTGSWTGSMDKKTPDGRIDSIPLTARFQQDGNTVTGSAGVSGFDPLVVEKGVLRDGQFSVHP